MSFQSAALSLGFVAGAALTACGSSSTSASVTQPDGGKTGSSSSGSGSSSSAHQSSSGPADAGSGPVDAAAVVVDAASGGRCVTLVAMNEAGTGIECDPVTNAGCTDGDGCDVNLDDNGDVIGFVCFTPPYGASLGQACETSDTGPFCSPGLTCVPTSADATSGGVCARYCCTNADCGAAETCVKTAMGTGIFSPVSSAVGLCSSAPDGGASTHADAGRGANDAAAHDAAEHDAARADGGEHDAGRGASDAGTHPG